MSLFIEKPSLKEEPPELKKAPKQRRSQTSWYPMRG